MRRRSPRLQCAPWSPNLAHAFLISTCGPSAHWCSLGVATRLLSVYTPGDCERTSSTSMRLPVLPPKGCLRHQQHTDARTKANLTRRQRNSRLCLVSSIVRLHSLIRAVCIVLFFQTQLRTHVVVLIPRSPWPKYSAPWPQYRLIGSSSSSPSDSPAPTLPCHFRSYLSLQVVYCDIADPGRGPPFGPSHECLCTSSRFSQE